jgi:hypothetical protein
MVIRPSFVRWKILLAIMGFAMACNISPPALRRTASPSDSSAPVAVSETPGIPPSGGPSAAGTPTPVGEIFPPTVDEVLAECPAAQEIREVDARISLRFESDPTAGRFVCTASAGSADLTRLQKNAYNAILIMKRITVDAPLPWTDQSLYDWFTGTITAIRFRSDIAFHSCCGTPPTINIKTELQALYSERWTAVGKLTALLVHEARHTYMAHTCQGKDRTISEMGAYGVEAHLYQLLAYSVDPDFLAMLDPGPTNDYREAARFSFYTLQKNQFCAEPTPAVLPPALAPAAHAGSTVWTEAMVEASRSGVPTPALLSPEADAGVPADHAVFTWAPVDFPGGVTYGIEVDSLFRFGKDWEYWEARTDAAGLAVPQYVVPLSFDGYSPQGRWRVWAISPTAGAGPKSEWRYFRIG